MKQKDEIKTEKEETKIALIGQDISYIKCDISEIKDAIKGLNTIFASKEQLAEATRQTEVRLGILENSSKFWKWFNPTVTGVFCSVLTFLFIHYLQNIK